MPELTWNDTSLAFLSSLYQAMPLFLVFDLALAAILGRQFLIWKSKQTQNTIWKARISGKWHVISLDNPSGSREITVYIFGYGVGGHYWAAILDLNIKMVSEHSKYISIRSGMPNLVVKVASFDFFGTFGSREITFTVSNMASAAILAAILILKVKTD